MFQNIQCSPCSSPPSTSWKIVYPLQRQSLSFNGVPSDFRRNEKFWGSMTFHDLSTMDFNLGIQLTPVRKHPARWWGGSSSMELASNPCVAASGPELTPPPPRAPQNLSIPRLQMAVWGDSCMTD